MKKNLFYLFVIAALAMAGCEEKPAPVEYSISVLTTGGGTVEIDVDGKAATKAVEGAKVTITPVEGELAVLFSVVKGGITLSGNEEDRGVTFSMPANDVEVKAEFSVFVEATADPVPASDVWATHAYVSGAITAGTGEQVRFGYRPVGGEWKYADAKAGSVGKYSATLTGLTPETEHEVCIEVDGELFGEARKFTTDIATPLENGGFEDWSSVPYGTSGTLMTWFPSKNLGVGEDKLAISEYWDTANEGLGMLGPKNITMWDETDLPPNTTGKRSVGMKSITFMGKFAAGNIYTGDFGQITTSPLGADVSFGRPFTARPSALKGWYKASPGAITHSNYEAKPVGDPDEYQIYIMLTDWTEPRTVNTSIPETLIDFSADYIVGLGQITDNEGITGSEEVAEWTEFNIPIKYRSGKTPSYIVVVACASKYGDYLTGSTASVLQVDDFELVYDENVVLSRK